MESKQHQIIGHQRGKGPDGWSSSLTWRIAPHWFPRALFKLVFNIWIKEEESVRPVRAVLLSLVLHFHFYLSSSGFRPLYPTIIYSLPSYPCRKHSTRKLSTTRKWGKTVRNPGLVTNDHTNAAVIVIGPGLNTWARLCSTQIQHDTQLKCRG